MIRTRLIVGCFAAGAVMALATGPAAAQAALGPYVSVGLGYDKVPDLDLNINGHTVSSQWKPGWAGIAAVGYKWFFGLRTEGEFSGRVSWIKTFNNANPWKGTQWDNSLMFNALYDFEFGFPITPYIGGGLGVSQVQWGNNFRVPTQATPTIYDAESIRSGWQAIAGATWAVTPQIAVAVDYRVKGDFGGFGFPGSVAGKFINNFHYETRTIVASIRYAFNP